ncbi:hypothetical protein DPMN_011314 [Dreissena polymorpha]|uniref:HTH psq-type domain-containing protein n=1 Tax=Dreissena polymorpha TaxID=45954 RepID=A0A9D4N0C1_DREPO|nr:hypothetical protein DPMN_011314 [Dreissena polymorpha]
MLDLQKAFDTVDHDILCRKLRAMGVESVEWFRSYLADRTHLNWPVGVMSKQAGASKYRTYSPSKVAAAVSMVQSGAKSKRKAAITYGIPRTTLIDKLSGKAPLGSNPGKPCVLKKAEEVVLVYYMKMMASIGYPLKRHDLTIEI